MKLSLRLFEKARKCALLRRKTSQKGRAEKFNSLKTLPLFDCISILSVTFLIEVTTSSVILVQGTFRTPSTLFIVFSSSDIESAAIACSLCGHFIKSTKKFYDSEFNFWLNSLKHPVHY